MWEYKEGQSKTKKNQETMTVKSLEIKEQSFYKSKEKLRNKISSDLTPFLIRRNWVYIPKYLNSYSPVKDIEHEYLLLVF